MDTSTSQQTLRFSIKPFLSMPARAVQPVSLVQSIRLTLFSLHNQMNQEENLNAYKDAYEVQFKFYDENQWYLAQYASLMSDTILKESLKSVLSLGFLLITPT
jgi:hypothetical protein